jgi:hypothetical protein
METKSKPGYSLGLRFILLVHSVGVQSQQILEIVSYTEYSTVPQVAVALLSCQKITRSTCRTLENREFGVLSSIAFVVIFLNALLLFQKLTY